MMKRFMTGLLTTCSIFGLVGSVLVYLNARVQRRTLQEQHAQWQTERERWGQ